MPPPGTIIDTAQGAKVRGFEEPFLIRCVTLTPPDESCTAIDFSSPVSGSDRLHQLDDAVMHDRTNGSVVARVRVRHDLRRNPDTMPSARLPSRFAAAAQLIGKLLKHVLSADEAVANHTRTHVGRLRCGDNSAIRRSKLSQP